MKTAVKPTSLAAYRDMQANGELQPREAQVMSAFRCTNDTFTRQQLVAKVGMPLNCVCGRVKSLLDKKALTIRGEHVDPFTRKRQELIGLPVQPGQQMDLLGA